MLDLEAIRARAKALRDLPFPCPNPGCGMCVTADDADALCDEVERLRGYLDHIADVNREGDGWAFRAFDLANLISACRHGLPLAAAPPSLREALR